MKHLLYKVNFYATETLGNGKERRVMKSVYIPRFDDLTRRHITEEERIARGTAVLLAEHYYNIQYRSTIATELLFG